MFANLTPEHISASDFKEDSVRELIILPILNRLGYTHTGTERVSRSKTLTHPFIYAGTRKLPVKLIPDYTLFKDDTPVFILDAKSPSENILEQKYVQQAYSYAIHPEIKCREFGLCNGLEFVVFDVDDPEPKLHLKFADFEAEWDKLEKQLLPKYLNKPELRDFAPDFGMKLLRLGISKDMEFIMVGAALNTFAKLDENTYTASSNCEFADEPHCVSFDFEKKFLEQIVEGLPNGLREDFVGALNRTPYQASAGLHIQATITSKIGDLTEGAYEKFVPLVVQKVEGSEFVPIIDEEPPQDIPEHIFQLHKAFKIRRPNKTGDDNSE